MAAEEPRRIASIANLLLPQGAADRPEKNLLSLSALAAEMEPVSPKAGRQTPRLSRTRSGPVGASGGVGKRGSYGVGSGSAGTASGSGIARSRSGRPQRTSGGVSGGVGSTGISGGSSESSSAGSARSGGGRHLSVTRRGASRNAIRMPNKTACTSGAEDVAKGLAPRSATDSARALLARENMDGALSRNNSSSDRTTVVAEENRCPATQTQQLPTARISENANMVGAAALGAAPVGTPPQTHTPDVVPPPTPVVLKRDVAYATVAASVRRGTSMAAMQRHPHHRSLGVNASVFQDQHAQYAPGSTVEQRHMARHPDDMDEMMLTTPLPGAHVDQPSALDDMSDGKRDITEMTRRVDSPESPPHQDTLMSMAEPCVDSDEHAIGATVGMSKMTSSSTPSTPARTQGTPGTSTTRTTPDAKRAQNRESAKRFRVAQKKRWADLQATVAEKEAEIAKLKAMLQELTESRLPKQRLSATGEGIPSIAATPPDSLVLGELDLMVKLMSAPGGDHSRRPPASNVGQLHRILVATTEGIITGTRHQQPYRGGSVVSGGRVGEAIWEDVPEGDQLQLRFTVLHATRMASEMAAEPVVFAYRRKAGDKKAQGSEYVRMKGCVHPLLDEDARVSTLLLAEFIEA